MNDEDFRKLLIAAAISAGVGPREAMETAEHVLNLYAAVYKDASNDGEA